MKGLTIRRTDSRHCASWIASEQDVVVLPVDRNFMMPRDDPSLGTLTDASLASCTGSNVGLVARTEVLWAYRRISISAISGPRYFGGWVVASRSLQVVTMFVW